MGIFNKLFGKKESNTTNQSQFEERYAQAYAIYQTNGLAACKPMMDELSHAGCIKATLFIRERLLSGLSMDVTEADRQKFTNAANNLLLIAANQGDTNSQFIVGTMFEYGNHFAQDISKAFHYYQAAANAGHVKAQNNLALCYLNGKGTNIDYNLCIHWLNAAASQNHPRAFSNLGYVYLYGRGVAADKVVARQYYEKSISLSEALIEEGRYGNLPDLYERSDLESVISHAKKALDYC